MLAITSASMITVTKRPSRKTKPTTLLKCKRDLLVLNPKRRAEISPRLHPSVTFRTFAVMPANGSGLVLDSASKRLTVCK